MQQNEKIEKIAGTPPKAGHEAYPLVGISKTVDLGDGQTAAFVFNVKENRKEAAMTAILSAVDSFESGIPTTIDGRIGWICDKLKEVSADVGEIKKSTDLVLEQTSGKQTMLSEFIESAGLPVKVYNILIEYIAQFGDVPLDSVLKGNFLKLRNAGNGSWKLFTDSRELYCRKP